MDCHRNKPHGGKRCLWTRLGRNQFFCTDISGEKFYSTYYIVPGGMGLVSAGSAIVAVLNQPNSYFLPLFDYFFWRPLIL